MDSYVIPTCQVDISVVLCCSAQFGETFIICHDVLYLKLWHPWNTKPKYNILNPSCYANVLSTHSIRKSYIVGPECLLWIMLFLNQALREFISKGYAEQPLPSLANIAHSCICFLLLHAPPGAAVSFHSQVLIRARPHLRGFNLTILVSLFGATPTMISIPV